MLHCSESSFLWRGRRKGEGGREGGRGREREGGREGGREEGREGGREGGVGRVGSNDKSHSCSREKRSTYCLTYRVR